jgi:hypothetical protein
MSESDAELLTELVAAFSTVIVETTRAISRNSGGNVSRHTIAIDIQKQADKLPQNLDIAKHILGNISAQLDDKPFTPLVIQARDK